MGMQKINEFLKSPRRSLIVLSLPVIVAALVETLYTVVDGVFVGRLGPEALAAITFAWPYFFILVALSLGINAGMSSRIARFLGAKKKLQAENTAMHGLLVAFVASVIAAAVGIPLLRYLFAMSGATGVVLEMATSYMLIILIGSVFMFLSYAINAIFSAQGDTTTAMKIDIYSLAVNIILAPIFIFVFHWGIKGAALATTIAVLFALIQSLYFIQKRSYLRLSFKCFKFSPRILKEIIFVGLPSMLMMLVVSFYIIFLNRAMAHYGVDYVAAFGIVSRLESVATLPIYGLSVGSLTLVGMFYGAKKIKELKSISWFAVEVSATVTAVVGLVMFIMPTLFLRIFTADPDVIHIGIPYLRLDMFTLPTMAVAMIVGRIMQGLGHGIPGLIINLVRVFGIAVPFAYLFVFVLGYGYLWIAVAMILGGITSTAIAVLWLRTSLRVLTVGNGHRRKRSG
jgi:putative MATE family efflux protein